MIATFVCNGAANAQHMGVGGGVLMVIYEKPRGEDKKELKALIGRESAPLWAHQDMYAGIEEHRGTGALSIAVPGEINGYWKAWERYGRVEWKKLYEPTIVMCREGWSVSKYMARALVLQQTAIYGDPTFKEIFVKSNNKTYEEGDIIKNPKLADTLEKIANDDTGKTFYTGALAQDIVDDIREQGGNITMADMASNEAIFYDPITAHLDNGDYDIYTPPPPSSGVIINFVMKVMDGYNYTAEMFKTEDDQILFWHRMIEAWKFGFGRRSRLGDKAKNNTEIDAMLENLVDSNYTEKIRKLIKDDGVYDVKEYDPDMEEQLGIGGTSHMVVLTADGGACSATSTVGSQFGAQKGGIGRRTGIIFNNDMELFNMPTQTNVSANYIQAQMRGRSSTSPVMILDKDKNVVHLVGGSGGPRIITASSYVAMASMWLGIDVRTAVDNSRFHNQLTSANILYHDEFPQSVLDGLKAKGHTSLTTSFPRYEYLAVVQAIDNRDCLKDCSDTEAVVCQDKCIKSVCDWRKGGYPYGY